MTASRMGRRSVHTVLAAFVATALAAAAAPAATAADRPPRPAASGISQYVEMIPTSSGERAVGVGQATTKPLPRREATLLQHYGGSDAQKLETVATSSGYGAPRKDLPVAPSARKAPEVTRLLKPRSAPQPKVLASSVGTIAGTSGGARIPVVFVLIVVTTLGMAVFAARRHNRP